ncbi:MAG: hypothetical protein EPO13_11285 [Actinomycetota bacterium]|nr:MAG: hypothetical protein EPO13_11285 [Actinomycetota bacterium]
MTNSQSTPDADDLRRVLERVASGDLDPAAAVGLLDAVAAAPTAASSAERGPATRVRVRGDRARLTVVSDPTVASLTAEGQHRITRDGDVLVVDVSPLASATGGWSQPDGYRMGGMDGWGNWRRWVGGEARATLRVNPALPLEIDAMASSLDIAGRRSPIAVRISASALRLRDQQATLEIVAASSKVDVEARLLGGSSSIDADMSRVVAVLLAGSEVAVVGDGEMSSIAIPSDSRGRGRRAAAADPAGGTGQLRVSGRMSKITVERRDR